MYDHHGPYVWSGGPTPEADSNGKSSGIKISSKFKKNIPESLRSIETTVITPISLCSILFAFS